MVAADAVPTDTWVLDCGLEFDPERRLFDHHQDRDLPSTALMVFERFYPELAESDLHGYFQLVSKVDTRGARSLDDADVVGESRDYWSVPHQLLVKAFESDPLAVVGLAARGLANKIDFEESKKTAADWLAEPGRLVCEEVEGMPVLVYAEMPPPEVADGLKGIDRDIVERHGAWAIYGFDKTDPTIRTLYRTDLGHDGLDFSRTRASGVIFNHQGGFLMRFRPTDADEWRRLVRESRI